MMTREENEGPTSIPSGQGYNPERAKDLPQFDTSDLFAHGKEVRIAHRGEIYRLRITAQQKLILTK